MSPKTKKAAAAQKKPEARWYIWGGIEVVSIGTRQSGRPHSVMLVREYSVMGSEKEARKVAAMNGGGSMTLRSAGRVLKQVDVPGVAARPPIVQRRRDGQVRTDACAVERVKVAPVAIAPTIEVKDTGDGIDWRVLVNGYGVASWCGTDVFNTGVSAREYAIEVARVLRLALGVPAVDPVMEAFKNAEPRKTPLTKEQRAMRKKGLAYVKAGRTFKTPVAHMTTLQLSAELRSLETKWDAFAAPDDEGHGGSPGEWMVERMDEIETEIRRGAARKREP